MTTAPAARPGRSSAPRTCAPPPAVAPSARRPVQVRDLGRIPYTEAVRHQEQLLQARVAGDTSDLLLLLEHPPVVTLGRRASEQDLLVSLDVLAQHGVELHRATRGGLATYHGPGQVVGYPIMALRELGRTVPDYVCGLQRTVISALARSGVTAYSDPDNVGVWTDRGKIGAIGIAVHHGVSMHGFAVNLQPNLAHFALINPCGLGERGVTSVSEILERPIDPEAFKRHVVEAFCAEFGLEPTP